MYFFLYCCFLLHFASVVDDAKCIVVTRVCVSVCLSMAACLHYCMDPGVTWGSGRGCPVVVQYWADLQSGHGLRCCGNITRTWSVCKYMLVLTLCLVHFCLNMSWFIFRYRNVCKWSVHDDVRCGVYELSGFWWRTWNVGSVFSLPVSTDIWWTNEPVDCTDKGWTWQRFAGQAMFLTNDSVLKPHSRHFTSHQLI